MFISFAEKERRKPTTATKKEHYTFTFAHSNLDKTD